MDRVVEQVRYWRDELLNLTRRDGVLDYRPTKRASQFLEIPGTTRVFDRLGATRSQGWHFFLPPEPDESVEIAEPTPHIQMPGDVLRCVDQSDQTPNDHSEG